MFMRMRRSALAAVAAGVVIASTLGVLALASPANAYGKANWEITFSATAHLSDGTMTGFWGWCDLAGGTNSGNTGDCQITQYVHPGFTCHESLDLTAWTGPPGATFLISGDATVVPASLTQACVGLFPGSTSFTGANSGIPAAPGHYSLGAAAVFGPGTTGPFNAQVNELP